MLAGVSTPEPQDLTRRERRKQEVRARILEAAVELFDDQGFAATKVAEICERADIANKTFFNHFGSKQDLLREIARDALDELLVDLDEASRHPGSTAERVVRFFDTVARNAEEAGPMHRELLNELIFVAHASGTESEQARRLHAAFGALVQAGRAQGDVSRTHSVQTQTEALLGGFYALMFNWANLDDYPLRRQAAAIARLLGDALGPGDGA